MGYQVIRQPDGHFAVYSSTTDTIAVWNATADQVVDWFVDRAVERARREAGRIVGHVATGEPRKAYYQFVMTWDEALQSDREHGGEAWREFPS